MRLGPLMYAVSEQDVAARAEESWGEIEKLRGVLREGGITYREGYSMVEIALVEVDNIISSCFFTHF